MLNKLFLIFVFVVLLGGFLIGMYKLLEYGFVRAEIRECEQWIKYSQELDGWYYTDWQVEQCEYHGFEL